MTAFILHYYVAQQLYWKHKKKNIFTRNFKNILSRHKKENDGLFDLFKLDATKISLKAIL